MNTNNHPNDEQLLTFFKALADANRLKIVGLAVPTRILGGTACSPAQSAPTHRLPPLEAALRGGPGQRTR